MNFNSFRALSLAILKGLPVCATQSQAESPTPGDQSVGISANEEQVIAGDFPDEVENVATSCDYYELLCLAARSAGQAICGLLATKASSAQWH